VATFQNYVGLLEINMAVQVKELALDVSRTVKGGNVVRPRSSSTPPMLSCFFLNFYGVG
jgi:hypothetical protein